VTDLSGRCHLALENPAKYGQLYVYRNAVQIVRRISTLNVPAAPIRYDMTYNAWCISPDKGLSTEVRLFAWETILYGRVAASVICPGHARSHDEGPAYTPRQRFNRQDHSGSETRFWLRGPSTDGIEKEILIAG